jgi:glycosyltransferase involved in cell wall biosynthesis
MKIYLENVNLQSSNGPNSFANKLIPPMIRLGHQFVNPSLAEINLCFIESPVKAPKVPRIQRLDGIYYNTRFNYNQQNANIKRTYDESNGVIYQSEYGKKLITKFFGEHPKSAVIHNGANMEAIQAAIPMKNDVEGRNIWSCAASWRPHKRLGENIRYFLEHKGEKDILIVAGETPKIIDDKSVYYMGNLTQNQLYSLYKGSTYFLHLGWLDCCPNVVVDARACGSKVICTTSGGSAEVAGPDAIIIEEEDWDFTPLDLYDPPKLNFEKKLDNTHNVGYNMEMVAKEYAKFLESFL